MTGVVASMLAKAKTLTGQQDFRYRFSSAGEPCVRALVYDAHDADDGKPIAEKPKTLKLVLHAVAAKAIADHIENAAKLLGFSTQTEALFEVGEVRIKGSSDVTDKGVFTIDIKIVGENQWSRIPRAKDWQQVHSYSVAHDTPMSGLLYGRLNSIGDDSPEFETREFWQATNIELARTTCAVWETVHHHRALRTLPERVFRAPSGWPCNFCRHLERCAPEENHDA